MISTQSVGLVIDTVVCLTLDKWETVSGQFGGYLSLPILTSLEMRGLAHCFCLKNCCALPDQMSFVLTFPRRRFILAMRDRHHAYQNEVASFVLRNREGLFS